MGTIKDRNGMDLTETEDIKKRLQEYPEELYKKDLHDPDNHDGVITHLEPDILEREVKWALGSITRNKTSGGDGIPVQYVSSVTQSCPTLATVWTATSQASLSVINSWSLLKLRSIELVMPSNHLILSRRLLLLPSIFEHYFASM